MSEPMREGIKNRRVVITGLGVIAPNGIGKDAFWKALREGRSGINKITSFDISSYPTKVAGEIKDFDPTDYVSPKNAKRMDKSSQLGVATALMAVEDANLEITCEDIERIGVVVGTAVGGQGWAFEQYSIFLEKGFRRINPFTATATFPNAISAQISIELGVRGASDTISSGCASSAAAIRYAFDRIRKKEADIMIAGGSEAIINPAIFGTFCAVRIMSTLNSDPLMTPRPFDKMRDGIVLGDGAGMLILEDAEHAIKRGAHIYAEIVGWGATCDAYHMMALRPDGKDAIRAVLQALEYADLKPQDISYIKMHGDGSVLNDKIETFIVKEVFGNFAYEIPKSSIKSMIGHTQGASGAIETVACALAINNNLIPPTINYEYPDPECDLDFVPNEALEYEADVAMVNTFGFGGKNVSLILKRFNG